jgi:hypothetical protein
MRYLIIKFMVQKRMPENFGFDDLIRNFMFFIETEAQSHKNSKILEMSKNLQFFCDVAEILSYPMAHSFQLLKTHNTLASSRFFRQK